MAGRIVNVEEKFRRKIHNYRTFKSDSDYIYDCKKIFDLISPFATCFHSYFLLAHGHDVESKEKIPLKSLSKCVSKTSNFETTFQEISCEEDIIRFMNEISGIQPSKFTVFKFENGNSICLFILDSRALVFGEEVLRDFSIVFNVTILRSHNYKNHIGAISHRYSKSEHGKLNPKFNNISELTAEVKKCFKIDAAYYVYVGDRTPSVNFQTKCLSPSGKSFRKFNGLSKTKTLMEDLRACIAQCQSRIGFLNKKSTVSYLILPVYNHNVRSSTGGRRTNGFVLFWKPSRFHYVEVRLIQDWLTSYSSKIHIMRANIVRRANEHGEFLLRYMAIGKPIGWTKVRKSFKRIADIICQRLVEYTEAESATVRLYNPQTLKLEKVSGYQSNLGEYKGSLDVIDDGIPIAAWKNSLNAFVFKSAHLVSEKDKPYASISDILETPNRYKEFGFKGVLKNHLHSRSEVAAQLHVRSAPFGVINVESPIPDAINDQDTIDLILQCAQELRNHWEKVARLRDAFGLAKLAHSQIKLHSIADLLINWDGKNKEQAFEIVHRLKDREESDGGSDFTGALDKIEVSKIISEYNKNYSNQISNAIHLKGKDDTKVSDILKGVVPVDTRREVLTSLFLIMDSILENIIKRSNIDGHNLSIIDLRRDRTARDFIRVNWETQNPLDVDVDDDIVGLSPIEKRGRRLHYGLFLIGVHTRQLAGTFSFKRMVDENDLQKGFRLILELPIF